MTGERSSILGSRRTSEDRVITRALRELAAGNPRPMIDAAAAGIVPTDAPAVVGAWALVDMGPSQRAYIVAMAQRIAPEGPAMVAAQAVRGIVHRGDSEWSALVAMVGEPSAHDWELAQAAYGPTRGLPGYVPPAARPKCGPGCSHLTQAEHAAERERRSVR